MDFLISVYIPRNTEGSGIFSIIMVMFFIFMSLLVGEGEQKPIDAEDEEVLDKKICFERLERIFFVIKTSKKIDELKKTRYLMTDGIYQKIKVDIEKLKKVYLANNIVILGKKILKMEEDYNYHIVYVEFIYKILSPNKISENHKEIWSFIKSKDSIDRKELLDKKCPHCENELEAEISIAKCSKCNTFINTGEYGWILSDIEESEQPYIDTKIKFNRKKKIRKHFGNEINFSFQSIEDKVKNGVIQIDNRLTLEELYSIKNFTTGKAYNKISNINKTYVFEEYSAFIKGTKSPILNGYKIYEDKKNFYLNYTITRRYKKENIEKNSKKKIEEKLCLIKLVKSKNEKKKKGDMYANQCPNCGKEFDNLSLKCSYCGEHGANPRYDWIIYDIEGLIE